MEVILSEKAHVIHVIEMWSELVRREPCRMSLYNRDGLTIDLVMLFE